MDGCPRTSLRCKARYMPFWCNTQSNDPKSQGYWSYCYLRDYHLLYISLIFPTSATTSCPPPGGWAMNFFKLKLSWYSPRRLWTTTRLVLHSRTGKWAQTIVFALISITFVVSFPRFTLFLFLTYWLSRKAFSMIYLLQIFTFLFLPVRPYTERLVLKLTGTPYLYVKDCPPTMAASRLIYSMFSVVGLSRRN